MINCINYSHPKVKALVEAVGKERTTEIYIENDFSIPEDITQYLDETTVLPNVGYQFKTVTLLVNNGDRVNSLYKQLGNTDTFWNKIQKDLQIPKDQIDLLKESKGDTIGEKLTSFAANYSYTVEINIAKENKETPYTLYKKIGEKYVVFNVSDEQLDSFDNKEDAIKKVKEYNYLNTQHYSNLTVPGGTNYTENEIATPEIVPSIKGHAQFATDKGIGWFRSDEQRTDDNTGKKVPDGAGGLVQLGVVTDSKTRRILEIQSDLFQKGRDEKKALAWNRYILDSKGDVIGENPNFQSEQDFLNLLRKDNNWVTFFVKSIIQDSAKKGYEKVLFPSGNTASKVEGHTTLEEFKKQKENRIKDLEKEIEKDTEAMNNGFSIEVFKSMKQIGVKGTLEENNEQLKRQRKEYIEKNKAEINQLKQELERVEGPEGFGALRPIYNFYENTVANVLKKQGYNVKQVTDEYGNTWNEVSNIKKQNIALSLDPEIYLPENLRSRNAALEQAKILTNKYPNYVFTVRGETEFGETTYSVEKVKKKPNVTTKVIEAMSRKMGLKFMYISERDLNNFNVPLDTNSFVQGKTVYLVKERVNDLIAVEEFLHPFVKNLQINNPTLFYKLLDDAKQIPVFQDLIKDIENTYGKIPGYDIENEIVTQVLSDRVLTNFQNNGMEETPIEKIAPFADSVNKALSYIANSIIKLLNELGFNIIPAKALNDFSTIRSMAAIINMAGTKFETAEVGTMLNLTDGQKQSIDMFDNLESKVSMNDDSEYVVEGYDNKWQRPSQLSRGVINQKDMEGVESEQYKQAGNRFHEFAKDIITKAFPDANRHNSPISLSVYESKYYDELKEFLDNHVINPAKKDGAVLRAETFVANEDLNIAGRIDLLRINKDGSYQVYDLKTRYRKEQTGKRRINKILEWTKQTGFYKQLLSTPNKVGTPIGKVTSVKVIELEGSQYEGEIKSIKNIGFVASREEKTGLAQLDDLISKLYNQIDIMKSNTPTSDVQKIAHEKLLTSRIELVQSLQLKKDYEALISHVSQELFILDDLITSGEVEKNAQVIMSDLKLYSMLSKFLEDSELSKEQINQLYVLQGKSVSLLAKFEAAAREKIKEESKRVGILGKLTDDLFQAVKDIGGIYKNLSGASTLDSPIVQTALRVINERRNKAVIKSKEAYEKIKESVDNLKKQLGTLDYSLFVNSEDNKNSLVDKYQYEFFKEASKNKNNLQWFAENATFDKEKYEKAYTNFIKYLDRFETAKKAEIRENVPENIEDIDRYVNSVYEKYRKNELTKWVAKNKSIVEYHIPKDKWIDPKWRDIKEGKYKGTAVEEFYDMYKRFLDEARDIAPDYLSPRFIPNFSASFVEKASNLGVIGGLNESWSNLLTELNTSYDPSYGLKDALTGEPIRALNIPGISNQVDTQSLDLGLSMQMFMEGVYKYKELSEIEETVFMAKHFLRNGKILKTEFLTGKTSEESAMKSNLADSFDGYVDAVLYGVQKENTGGFKVTGGKGLLGKPATLAGLLPEGDTVMVSWAKLADKLLKYTSLKNLGFNIFSPITNLLAGTGNMYATGFGNRYYNTEDLTWAITAVTSNDLTEEGKLANAIYKELDLNSKEIQFRNNELSKYTADKMLEKYNGMTMMRLSEEALHKSVVLAMLKSNKYNIKLSDFKLENGKLVMANEANNSLTRSLFKAKTTRVSQLVFGAMNDDDFLLANKSVIGRMLIQHRGWLPQMFMERWGSKRFDYNLEMEMEGRYRTLGRVVGHLISKQKVGNLTELEKYNLKAAGMELSLVIAIGLLLKALAAGLDDDDKKESWYKFTTLVGQRTLSELGFFVDVTTKSQFQILLSPAASISVYEDYGKFVNALWKETTGDEKERKRAKPLKAAGKLVPVVGQLQRFIDELFNINLSTFDEEPKKKK